MKRQERAIVSRHEEHTVDPVGEEFLQPIRATGVVQGRGCLGMIGSALE